MSLRLRVVIAIALVLLASSVAGMGLAGWHAKRALHVELATALTGGRQTVDSAFEDLPRSDHPQRDLRQLVATFDGNRHLAAALIGPAGETTYASHTVRAAPAPGWFAAMLHTDVHSERVLVPMPGYGVIVLSPAWSDDVAALWTEFLDLALVLLAALVLSAGLVWLTVGRALRPLSDFSAAFVRIGSGDYGGAVRAQGPLELLRLALGINAMTTRLSAMQARNQALEDQLLTLQEEERADLARDLHDEIGPHLFAVNVDAAMVGQLVADGKSTEALEQVRSIQAAVAHMQRLVREILSRLRPTQVIEMGLAAAIGDLVTFWRARHPDIVFDVRLPSDEDVIGDVAQETIYRIVQEGLSNAVRHARPSRIEIAVSLAPDGQLIARVTDDGASKGTRRSEGGFGLVGMRERVAAARGKLTIERSDAGGWSVIARLPTGLEPQGGLAQA